MEKDGFIAQTADAYALPYEVVENIKKKSNDLVDFYERLEHYLKEANTNYLFL